MSRLVVVSNRVQMPRRGAVESHGGLAVAMLEALRKRGGLWFGWSGEISTDGGLEPKLRQIGQVVYATVNLSSQDYEEYYAGFANSVLWPLLHYRLDLTDFSRRDMAGYHRVNAGFARQLMPLLRDDDLIWVHDYHLIPLCQSLREAGARQRIGFFLHIPWPATQVLLALPNHRSLVRALLSYDVVGFQTDTDRECFLDYIRAEGRGVAMPDGEVRAYGERALVGTFPIGIDTAEIVRTSAGAAMGTQAARLRESVRGRKLIIGVDRLDYTKGLIERIGAYEHLLANHPEYRRNVVFLQITPPSRAGMADYESIRHAVQDAAGELNGRYAAFDWTPFRYLNRGFNRTTVMGFLRQSQIGLITPLRDGMNLVAKEFVAAQPRNNPGVLVLSRFAGAAAELDGALVVNPHDIEGVGDALYRGLAMPLAERKERWRRMMSRLRQWDVHAWREAFLGALAGRPSKPSDAA